MDNIPVVEDPVKIPIPTKTEEITTEWLNLVLKKHKIQVESFKFLGDAKNGRGHLSSLNRLQLKIFQQNLNLSDENHNESHNDFDEINIVIKAVPSDPQLKNYIVRAGFCQSELQIYMKVLPEVEQLLDNLGVSKENRFVHPFCYYGAEEFGETNEDYKFILVLEDLVASKYELWNEGQGLRKSFDWEHTNVALKQIALFHGSLVAYKLGKGGFKYFKDVFPNLFNAKVDDPMLDVYIKTGFEATNQVIQDAPNEIPEGLLEHLQFLQENFKDIVTTKVLTVDPNAINVIRHQDLHVNNVMFSYGEGGPNRRIPVQAKWFDFQACQEGSPMLDLGFFLILNCLPAFSTTQLDRSLQVYHETFTGILAEAGVPLKDYTFEKVKRDFKGYRLSSICHIISGAPVWCCEPNGNQESRDRLRKAIIYAYNNGELEWTQKQQTK